MSPWAIWLIIAAVSAGLEVLSGDFFLLMVGGGAAAAAIAGERSSWPFAGLVTHTRFTPATRAGIAVISTVLGYEARPPGA